MKKVLLLGDSIRMGYEPLVRAQLAEVAHVVAPAENGRFAKHTLWGRGSRSWGSPISCIGTKVCGICIMKRR
ncbi:MAG: hydrolase family protein [Paenibacillus sp.]|nr:hydrolase family protein [Paenibacillus sp.]